MVINTERFQLKFLMTKDVTEKYLSWFSESQADYSQHIGNIKYEPINFSAESATTGILIGDREWGVLSEVAKEADSGLQMLLNLE